MLKLNFLLLLPSLTFANPAQIDAELNAVYQQTLKTAQTSDLKNAYAFVKSNQKNWLKYSLEYCDALNIASSGQNVGSYYKTAVNSCFAELSKERIKQLKSFTCKEGDLAANCLFY